MQVAEGGKLANLYAQPLGSWIGLGADKLTLHPTGGAVGVFVMGKCRAGAADLGVAGLSVQAFRSSPGAPRLPTLDVIALIPQASGAWPYGR